MTLRNRIAVAAALDVLVVVAAVGAVLYGSYAASLRIGADAALVNAAQQASRIAQQLKQSGSAGHFLPDFNEPVTVGSTQVQLIIGPVAQGQPTRFGALRPRDVQVAREAQPAYFADGREDGEKYRVYIAAMPGTSGAGLVMVSRAENADDGALRDAVLLLATLTMAACCASYGITRLTAERILRPIGNLTAATEHVAQTGDFKSRLNLARNDEVGRLSASFDKMLSALDESVTAQQQLVADASHELRTPLTSLTTNLDLLEDGAALADPQAPALVRAATNRPPSSAT